MISRDEQLTKIEEYIRDNGVIKGPTAFVCPMVQANIPDRKFIHSNVKLKFVIKKTKK